MKRILLALLLATPSWAANITTTINPNTTDAPTAVATLLANDVAINAAKLETSNIDTLAELNAIVTDATLVDTTDARLTDARTPTAHNHPASEVTSGTFADARIAQSNVTQHQAALTITESQISDLPVQVSVAEITAGSATGIRRYSPADIKAFVDTHAGGGGDLSATDIDTLAELNAVITDATLIATTDARLSDARTPTAHNHAASDVTSGTFADARISQSSVTQHQAALTITESQISDLSHTVDTDDQTAGEVAVTPVGNVAATTVQAAIQELDSDLTAGLSAKQDAATAATQTDIANMVESDPTGITGADAVTNIVSLTQAEYAAIGTPSATTLYVITD